MSWFFLYRSRGRYKAFMLSVASSLSDRCTNTNARSRSYSRTRKFLSPKNHLASLRRPSVRRQCECKDILHCCSTKEVMSGTEIAGGRQNDGDYGALTLFELAPPLRVRRRPHVRN